MAKKIKNITLTDDMQEMIAKLRSYRGFPNDAMVIYAALSESYLKFFPAYTQMNKQSPADKVQRKNEEKEARAQLERGMKLELVKQLGGKINADDKNEIVHYYTYVSRKRYAQETPLHLVTQEIIDTQYSPDKATVERLRKEGKTDY